jgi:DNA-binding NtrC family response regulator
MANILIVDDEPPDCELLAEVLSTGGHQTTSAYNGKDAIEYAKKTFFDIAICDIRMPEMDGLALLRNFKSLTPKTFVILMTAFGSLETAIEAMREGAFDCLSKPFRIEEIKSVVERVLEEKKLLEEKSMQPIKVSNQYKSTSIVGKSHLMLELYKTIALCAKGDTTVLIQGETGTGKELVARAIHHNSPRSTRDFLAINCAGIPEGLLESELFGHKKGAFTGAIADKIGLFERASGGTLFLDEIGSTTVVFQAKLLRVLEQGEVLRVGDTEPMKVDVRIIASSHVLLEEEVKERRFREDLYFRLSVVVINMPPLRERRDDIPILSDYFLEKYNKIHRKNILGFSPEAREVLINYKWPGNVRELEHTIERAVTLNTGSLIHIGDLPPLLRSPQTGPRYRTLEEIEKEYILQVLRETQGNRGKASNILGIDRKTLYKKILKYGIDVELR